MKIIIRVNEVLHVMVVPRLAHGGYGDNFSHSGLGLLAHPLLLKLLQTSLTQFIGRR